jgi:hypothetical protein
MKPTNDSLEASRSRLLELNEKLVLAEQSGTASDLALLASVLSDDLVFRRADGTVVDKAAYLAAVPAAARKLTERRALGIDATLLGAAALVTLTVTATSHADGQPRHRSFKNIRFFVAREGKRLLEHWYNEETTIASSDAK